MNIEYALESSLASLASVGHMNNGRGVGRGRVSNVREAIGLFWEEAFGVFPGKGTSRDR